MPERSRRSAFFSLSGFPRCDDPLWCPMADVYRMRDGWILKFDLAGVKAEDVRVQVEGSRITVRGTRRDWLIEGQGYSCYSMEISYNRFERTIELPCYLDAPAVALEFRDGILLVRLTCERPTP